MRIHIDQVIDYVSCPALYKFRNVDKLEPPQPKKGRPTKNSIVELYDEALHKAVAYIFNSVQDGRYPSLTNMKNRWGKLWIAPRAKQEDIKFKQVSWRDTHELKRKQGWDKIEKLWLHYKEDPGSPIMVNYPYTVQIGKHTLEGTIDLVRVAKKENGREHIEMVEFITDERNAPFLHTRRDWRVTAASYAFRKIMKANEEKIVYHGIISGKLLDTTRDEQDYKQLEHLLDAIEHMQTHEIYYPVFNERCNSCSYQKYCEKGWFDVKTSKQ
ncbi:RecB [Bacillus phage 0305phi8-36]|uniref:RecB n=1 Tax=Bacillus phage 0305phi8-36 TaxID=458639 RepID=UPI00015A1F2E|nr:RecB [Bacillus phage 0305phi8-36]ABS83748.1 RecB [Bacillus phage 0305phi8-36]